MRYRQAILIVRVLFVVLGISLFSLQVVRGNYYFNLSQRNSIRVVSLEAARGRIFDRNGAVLADTVPSYVLSVIPQEIRNKDVLFEKLSALLGISIEEISRTYHKNFFNPFTPVRILEQLDKNKIIVIEENTLQLPGVIIEAIPQRAYPFQQAAAHVLGYLNKIDPAQITRLRSYGYQPSDVIGKAGVEAYYDLFLRGEKGGEQIEVDNRGRKVRMVGYKPPKPGKDIQVSIDIRIQEIVDRLMSGHSGAVVIMEPYSGEIIAMGSYPRYDPKAFVIRDDRAISGLFGDAHSPMFDRAIAGQYSPGSVFKIVTATSALEQDPLLINTRFQCRGSLRVGNRSFHCLSAHGDESLRDGLVHSCNVYFYNLGLLIGPEQMAKYAHRLGLAEKTGIDLKYEAKGSIPSPQWRITQLKKWYSGDTANMSIGQGEVLVTPLQMARMVSVMANGGTLVWPHLIKAIGGKQINLNREKTNILSAEVARTMNAYLGEVVSDPEGTARIAKIEGLAVFGKTGTTQIVGKKPHGWFVGYVGTPEPRYAFCVFLENGGSSYYACVMARTIFEQLLQEGVLQ